MKTESRAALEADILQWMQEDPWHSDAERFERLALGLFRYQFGNCRPYGLLCRSLDVSPDTVSRANAIPAVPAGAFKDFELRCFEAHQTIRTFRTSGTTTEKRGALFLDRLDLYEASLLSSLRTTLTTGWAPKAALMRILAPDPAESPESSLSYMFGALVEADGAEGSGFDLKGGALDLPSLRAGIARAKQEGRPMLVAGTAFAFVHLIDEHGSQAASAGAAEAWSLPPGSRVMETGGFKGRSREIPREDLHAALARLFDLPAASIVNQYGMTELGSQFYDASLIDPEGPRRKRVPPWTRVRFMDPDLRQEVPPGETGLILIQDLANTGSVAAIQTADLGRAVLDANGRAIGFEVLGRAAAADARGCSIAADAMLEAARGTQR